jgi:hypothetical protein
MINGDKPLDYVEANLHFFSLRSCVLMEGDLPCMKLNLSVSLRWFALRLEEITFRADSWANVLGNSFRDVK